MVFGNVWIPTDRGNGETSWVDSLASAVVNVDDCCRADWGENRYSNGWVWWYDWPTGSVYRQHSMSESPRAIRVVENLPMANGLCVTSIAIGAGAVWATVTAASHLTCPR
jgi:hypothetical protein